MTDDRSTAAYNKTFGYKSGVTVSQKCIRGCKGPVPPLPSSGGGFRLFLDNLETEDETHLNSHRYFADIKVNMSSKGKIIVKKNHEKAQADVYMKWTGNNRLHYFAKKGDIVKCMSFIDKGVSILAPSSTSKFTALHYSVQAGHTSTAEALLRRAATIGVYDEVLHARASTGQTPLHSAFQCGRISTAIRLIELGARLHLVDAQGRQPVELCDRRIRGEAEECIKRAIISFHFWQRRRGLVYFCSLLRRARNEYLADYHTFPAKKSEDDDVFLDIMNPIQYLALAEQRGLEAENEWRFKAAGYGGLEDYCLNGGLMAFGEPPLWQEGGQTFDSRIAHWRSLRTHSRRKCLSASELPASLFFRGTEGDDSLTRMLYELCCARYSLPLHPQRGCQVPVGTKKEADIEKDGRKAKDSQLEAERAEEERRWLCRARGPHAPAWRQVRKLMEPRNKAPLVRMIRNDKGRRLYFRASKEFLEKKGSVCPTTQLMCLAMLNKRVKKTVCEFL